MRQRNIRTFVPARRAWQGLLFSSALLMSGSAVLAQAQPTATDAERIAQMRDLAKEAKPTVITGGDPSAESSLDSSADPGKAVKGGASAQVDSLDASGLLDEAGGVLEGNEALPLGAGNDEGGIGFFASRRSDDSGAGAGGDNWVLSTLAALGVVIGLVFVIRWVLRRGGVASTSTPRSSVVEVLSRSTVAPRSHVVLMRVGQRVLIVSDSPAGMRTLAQVSDPEEVAELLGLVDASAPASMTDSFQGVMKKLSGQWSDGDEPQFDSDPEMSAGVGVDRSQGAMSSLRGRLAMLSKAGGGA